MSFFSRILSECNTLFKDAKAGQFHKLFRGDKVVWGILVALSVISILAVYSATSTVVYKYSDPIGPIMRHASHLLMGIVGAFIVQRMSYKVFYATVAILPISLLILGVTLLIGEEVNGAQRWITIGGISLQPSELAKISLVGFLSYFLAKIDDKNEKAFFRVMCCAILLTCGLIVTENLSTATLIFTVSVFMLIIGQVKFKRIGLFIGRIALAVVLLVSLQYLLPDSLKIKRFSTWSARIERVFTQAPDANQKSTGYVEIDGEKRYYDMDNDYQAMHAKMAVANGKKLLGVPGSGTGRDFLPQAYSDFIFAIIIEETGVIGAILVMFLYIVLLIRCAIIANSLPTLFPVYLIMGLSLMLVLQAFAHMFVALGIGPVTGLPLPLLSRGGTSTIITCLYFGIILACSNIKEEEPDKSVDEDIANTYY